MPYSLAARRDCEVKWHIHWRISWDCEVKWHIHWRIRWDRAVAARTGLSYSAIFRGSSANKICVCTIRVNRKCDLGLKQPRNVSETAYNEMGGCETRTSKFKAV
jgi:hypothetical protein